MNSKNKVMVTALSFASAAGIALTIGYEGSRSKPYKDVAGVVTAGYGSTKKPDGSPIKMSDPPLSKKQAMEYLIAHMSKDAKVFNRSLQGVALPQIEYDLYMDFTYQYGINAWLKSSMLKNLKSGQYIQACQSLLKWRFVGKKDCALYSNNCRGVWIRQSDRYCRCMGVNK